MSSVVVPVKFFGSFNCTFRYCMSTKSCPICISYSQLTIQKTVLFGNLCARSLVQFSYYFHCTQTQKTVLLGTVLYICPRYFVNLHITLDLLNILFRIWICKSFINKKLNLFYHLQRSWWTNTGYHTFQAHVFNWTTNVKIQTYINCSIIGIFCLVKTSICFFN